MLCYVLLKLKEEHREDRRLKENLRARADRERDFFENAVVFHFFEELRKRKKLTRDEKGFVGVTLGDMAAVIAMPVYRAYVFGNDEVSLKNAIVAASKNAKNTMEILCDSLGIERDFRLTELSGEYAAAALKHFSSVLENEKSRFAGRENEYIGIMNKLKTKKGEFV